MVVRNDSRRRRVGVVTDTSALENTAPPSSPPKKSSTLRRAYSFGADRRNQLKTTDLIPKRFLSYLLVVLGLVASLGVLNLLAASAPQWSSHLGQRGMTSLSLTGRGTLASWFSSFLLIITGLASLQIYALRQHRRDDYRGTYRLWVWMAGLLVLGSVNCVVDLFAIGTHLIQQLTSFSLQSNPWLPVTIKLVALTVLVARGLYEVRASRGAFALVVFVWVAYSIAAVLQLPATRPLMVHLDGEATIGNCLLFATAGLLLAQLTYARYVYLRAHGLISVKVRTPKEAKAKKAKKRDEQKKAKSKSQAANTTAATQTGPSKKSTSKKFAKGTKKQKPATPQSQPSSAKPASPLFSRIKKQQAAAPPVKSPNSSQNNLVDDDDQEHEGIIKMSKSEKRRQRKDSKRRRAA